MREREFFVYRIQRVREGVNNSGFSEILNEVVDVFPDLLYVCMDLLVDVVGKHMRLAAILGEVGGYLFTDEGAGQMCNFERPGDRVVVCDGNNIHTLVPGYSVERLRFGEALRAAKLLEYPLGWVN